MVRTLTLSLIFFPAALFSISASPPDSAPVKSHAKSDAVSIDDKIAKLIAARKQLEDDKAVVAALEADLRASVKDLADRLAALGIILGPPTPVDPLVNDIRAAYAADPSVGKASDARLLATIYRQIASQMANIGTTDTLASTIASLTRSQLSGRLATVTPLFGKDFVKHVPAGSATLTETQKAEVVSTLTRYAAILDGLK